MATSSTRCRLLELPPELRNRIYDYIYEDTTPTKIELFSAITYTPRSALVATCRQIHNETDSLQEVAQAQYWHDHIFTLEAVPKASSSSAAGLARHQSKLLAQCSELSKRVKIHRLEIVTHFDYGSTFSRIELTDGEVSVRFGSGASYETAQKVFAQNLLREEELAKFMHPSGTCLKLYEVVQRELGY